jgi:ribosomal protein L21E
MNTQPFSIGQTTKISASSTSQNIVIDSNTNFPGQTARVVVTSGNVYIRFSNNSADTASAATDMPVLSGTVETFSKGDNTRIAIVADTTATVWVTVGEGM